IYKRLFVGSVICLYETDLGKEAGIGNEQEMVVGGIMTRQAVENRRLLRKVMRKGGFTALPSEWWHFNLVSRAKARASYKLLDF
ncbi:MAG: hypothetical protein K2K33_04090, partial [Muribaculaceae bacterium]|nr:hypothetical protein [Muribaculaceae bacterium]